MKPSSFRHLILFCLQLLSLSLMAQKQFRLTIRLPQAIVPEKIEAWLDNGKEVKKIKPQAIAERRMILAGDYYSTYAVITLQYPPDSATRGFAKAFFVGEKPAIITFKSSHAKDLPFANYSSSHVLDFEKEKRQMDDFSAAELKTAMEYVTLHGNKLFASNDTAVRNYYFNVLTPALGKKKLEYIIRNPQSYYSFYSFRTDVARPNIASWDSLLLVFNSFPDAFKYSDEGNYLNAFLQGRLSRQKGDAIDFVSRDINRNVVTLSQFKYKKAVLLHFWATWCTPCMRELPALREIGRHYKGQNLQIISLALPSSKYADYLATIDKFQMNWIHVYDDPVLQNKYGNQPIPRICLIDKTGKLIYDNVGLGKNDDFELNELKEKLQEIIDN
jgi:thiol-disulfide isomerase/thioredoxin